MDECVIREIYIDRTHTDLECDKCIFNGTEECKCK